MATQSLEFGYTAGQTLTAKLFAIGSDTVVQTASSVTERTNAEGRYLAVFTDATAANYLLVYYLGGTGAGSEKYVLTLDTATFQPQSEKLTAEIASAVEAVQAAAHGAGAWEGGVGAGGGGPVPFTITVQSDTGDPLPGVVVYLLDSNSVPLNLWLPTNDDGEAEFHVSAGDYRYAAGSRVGYSSPPSAAKTIASGTPATATVVLTAQTTTPPSDAVLCVIDDYVYDASKNPVAGASVVAVANKLAQLSGAGVLTTEKTKATTDANGNFTLELVRADAMTAGANYTITIKHQSNQIFRQVTGPIPNAASATLKQIEAGA